ncbi:hypothetical protein SARC_09535, partial [Sphaeroforma arctica JP610]
RPIYAHAQAHHEQRMVITKLVEETEHRQCLLDDHASTTHTTQTHTTQTHTTPTHTTPTHTTPAHATPTHSSATHSSGTQFRRSYSNAHEDSYHGPWHLGIYGYIPSSDDDEYDGRLHRDTSHGSHGMQYHQS